MEVCNHENRFSSRVAIRFIVWLGLCAWLVDKTVVVGALAVKRLSTAARTSLHVATKNVQLAFRDAAVMAWAVIRAPIVGFGTVANP
jgi:hypothetical protein